MTARKKAARYSPIKKAPASSKPNKKAPPERRTERPPSKTAASKGRRKLVKTAKQKDFKLVADKRNSDPLVMKCMEFDIDDEDSGSNISQHLGVIHKIEAIIKRKGKKKYIMGTVIFLENKNKANTVSYDFQWEQQCIGRDTNRIGGIDTCD